MQRGLTEDDLRRIQEANPEWQMEDDERGPVFERPSFVEEDLPGAPGYAATPQPRMPSMPQPQARMPAMPSFGASGGRGVESGAEPAGLTFFDKSDDQQYLTKEQKKALKAQLYAALADRMKRRGEVTSKAYYDQAEKGFAHQERVADANALGALMLNAGDRAGTVLGRGPASNFGDFANALDSSRQNRFNNMRALRGMEEQVNMNDLNVARYLSELERGDEARKLAKEKLYADALNRRRGLEMKDSEFALRQRQQDEVERANKAREEILRNRPAGGSQPSYTPIASGEDGVMLINPKNPNDTRTVQLPKGFTPKGAKNDQIPTESERKAGLQSEVSIAELPYLEEMEKTYRPGLRDSVAGAVGGSLGNYAYSDAGRRYEAAAKRILDPMLRAMSGANAPQSEIDAKRESYIIRPGDDEATIADKIQQRRVFIEALRKSAGRGAQSEMPPPPQLNQSTETPPPPGTYDEYLPGKGYYKKVPGGYEKVK